MRTSNVGDDDDGDIDEQEQIVRKRDDTERVGKDDHVG